MHRHPGLLDPERTALVVVDVQERFRPVVQRFDALVENCVRLVRTFRALALPVLVTEQYPKGLGPTVAELRAVLGDESVPSKTAFSSMRCDDVTDRLAETGARTIVVCGIEAHVCVSQSVHDLLASGHRVHVVVDAVSSRRATDREVALARLVDAGAVQTTAEAVAFELLGDAAHPRFKEVQALFR